MTSTDRRSGDWYTYTGEHLREVAFPLGGIGTGSVCLTGRGAFVDWEIFKGHYEMTYPTFLSNLVRLYPKLTKQELKLCALIKIGLS